MALLRSDVSRIWELVDRRSALYVGAAQGSGDSVGVWDLVNEQAWQCVRASAKASVGDIRYQLLSGVVALHAWLAQRSLLIPVWPDTTPGQFDVNTAVREACIRKLIVFKGKTRLKVYYSTFVEFLYCLLGRIALHSASHSFLVDGMTAAVAGLPKLRCARPACSLLAASVYPFATPAPPPIDTHVHAGFSANQ